jgi:hypothetical protein
MKILLNLSPVSFSLLLFNQKMNEEINTFMISNNFNILSNNKIPSRIAKEKKLL